MRLIDADKLVAVTLTDGGYWTKEVYYKADIDAAPTVYPPPNDPLTLEQLQEMDGEPVWVTPTKASKNWWMPSTVYWDRPKMAAGWWMLVNAGERKCFESHLASAYFSDYGKNWLAYRRKPEGEGI